MFLSDPNTKFQQIGQMLTMKKKKRYNQNVIASHYLHDVTIRYTAGGGARFSMTHQ